MTDNKGKYGWISLISFGAMYNFVYMGRFGVINFMDEFGSQLKLTSTEENILTISVFASYAAGSLICGFIADRWDAKKTVVLAGMITSILNIAMLYAGNFQMLLAMCILNGIVQSAIWVGGINIIAHWFAEDQWGKSVGIANFFSGISHITAYLLPAVVGAILPLSGWKTRFIISIAMLVIFTLIFGVLCKGKREDAGLEPYKHANEERIKNETFLRNNKWKYHTLLLYLFRRKYFLMWCFIAFLSSVCRYGLFQWIPVYFGGETKISIFSPGYGQIFLPLGMAIGTMIITWVTGKHYLDNKGIVVVAMAALCASVVIVFPMVGSAQALRVGVFITGFVIYGINGVLWVHAIDQGGRIFAGTVAGILNGFAYLGATLQTAFYSAALAIYHSYVSICLVTELMCILMVICAVMICRNAAFIEEAKIQSDSKIY